MFSFPKNLYTDVRIEDVFETTIQMTMDNLDQLKEKTYKAAFIRLYDGKKWYYAATTDVSSIQKEIDSLATLASPDPNISDNPLVKKFEVNTGDFTRFKGEKAVSTISKEEKLELLKSYIPYLKGKPYVKMWRFNYIDQLIRKQFISSKGADLIHDFQRSGLRFGFQLVDGEKILQERHDKASDTYADLKNCADDLLTKYNKCVDFFKNAVQVEPGNYTVILSPEAAGVFAHESFGHKSEADFMLGDETMKKEWQIGKKVGVEILSIVDDGQEPGSGYVLFDDEGTKAQKTYLIKNGNLQGRLHSVITAADLEENVTGNARAKNFEFEPIVRMTTTYIEKGDTPLEKLIAETKEGILVETIKHGSGMSTFTLAPSLAYKIKDGKITEPLKISVVSGNVFATLGEIDGLSREFELLSFILGGCGKMEQFPLPVGFGGPYVRVNNLSVQ